MPNEAVKDLEISNVDDAQPGKIVKIQMPPAEHCSIYFLSGTPLKTGQIFHIISTVQRNGTPSLRTQKRLVICAVNPRMLGGRDLEFAITADWLRSLSDQTSQ